jgi:hypothetical protein
MCSKGIGLALNGVSNVIIQSTCLPKFILEPCLFFTTDIQITDLK